MTEDKETQPDESVIVLEHVSKRFGSAVAVDDVHLSIRKGEFFSLLGPSGSGKTTLVRLIAGSDRPDAGTVSVLGRPVPHFDVLLRTGYMAQSDSLYLELSARENLEFFGGLFGLRGGELGARSKELLEIVDLTEHADRPVQVYSGGMKRRLSLAIALLHRPQLLLLDEPTVGIDPVLRRRVWAKLREFVASGGALLLTTHVMDEAEHCDRVLLLRDGRLLADGSPGELRARAGAATLEDAFLHFGGASR